MCLYLYVFLMFHGVICFECCCFLLLIIIDEGAGDADIRFVLLKPGLSEAVFKLLL